MFEIILKVFNFLYEVLKWFAFIWAILLAISFSLAIPQEGIPTILLAIVITTMKKVEEKNCVKK